MPEQVKKKKKDKNATTVFMEKIEIKKTLKL